MFCLKNSLLQFAIGRMQTLEPHVITQTILDANNVGILKNTEFIFVKQNLSNYIHNSFYNEKCKKTKLQ